MILPNQSQRAMRPAPHIRPDGSVTRPVPQSLEEAWQRAIAPTVPPWNNRAWDQFIEGLKRCPQRRRDLVEVLADELAVMQGGAE